MLFSVALEAEQSSLGHLSLLHGDSGQTGRQGRDTSHESVMERATSPVANHHTDCLCDITSFIPKTF